MIGYNGRPIVLNMKYAVDVGALERYASTEEATRAASDDPSEPRAALTEREMIERFLHNVKRDKDGKGTCTVAYTRCQIGQALVDAQLLQHTRIYPDKWPSCATQLGKRLRSLALGKEERRRRRAHRRRRRHVLHRRELRDLRRALLRAEDGEERDYRLTYEDEGLAE